MPRVPAWNPQGDVESWPEWKEEVWTDICRDAHEKKVFPPEDFEYIFPIGTRLKLIPRYRALIDTITALRDWEEYHGVRIGWVYHGASVWKLHCCTASDWARIRGQLRADALPPIPLHNGIPPALQDRLMMGLAPQR